MLTSVSTPSVPSYPINHDIVNYTDSLQASLFNYGNPKWKNPVGKFFKVIENGQAMKFLEKDNQEPAVTAIQDFVDYFFGWGSYSKKSSQEKKNDRAIEVLEKENQKSTVTAIGDFVNDLFGWRSYSKKSPQEKRDVLKKNEIQQEISFERCANRSEQVTFYIKSCEIILPTQIGCWEYPTGCSELNDDLKVNSTILNGPINTYTLSLFANKAGSEDTPTDIPEELKDELSKAIFQAITFSGKILWPTKNEPFSRGSCTIPTIHQISTEVLMFSENISVEYFQLLCTFFTKRMINYKDKIFLMEQYQESEKQLKITIGISVGCSITIALFATAWFAVIYCSNKKKDKKSFYQELIETEEIL